MRVVLVCHSLESCWNHGNAHFLRGIARELLRRGHEVRALEPADGWSRRNLLADHGPQALESWRSTYPELSSVGFGQGDGALERALDRADLVLVHEWTEPAVVRRIGELRRRGSFVLLYHDTHHRLATDQDAFSPKLLEAYDGVLAFGASLRERYRALGWGARAWVWHEAADTSVFHPRPAEPGSRVDLVWIGNWGDEERTAELHEFLLQPVRALGLSADIHGVRYPAPALDALAACGARYRGWLPNHRVPDRFARARVTVHVPRRPYVAALPGIPTIRVFEALACGIPLVTAPWPDDEGLFGDGCFLKAADGERMEAQLRLVLSDRAVRAGLVERGLAVVRARHTCAHRVDELLAVHASIADHEPTSGLAACA